MLVYTDIDFRTRISFESLGVYTNERCFVDGLPRSNVFGVNCTAYNENQKLKVTCPLSEACSRLVNKSRPHITLWFISGFTIQAHPFWFKVESGVNMCSWWNFNLNKLHAVSRFVGEHQCSYLQCSFSRDLMECLRHCICRRLTFKVHSTRKVQIMYYSCDMPTDSSRISPFSETTTVQRWQPNRFWQKGLLVFIRLIMRSAKVRDRWNF